LSRVSFELCYILFTMCSSKTYLYFIIIIIINFFNIKTVYFPLVVLLYMFNMVIFMNVFPCTIEINGIHFSIVLYYIYTLKRSFDLFASFVFTVVMKLQLSKVYLRFFLNYFKIKLPIYGIGYTGPYCRVNFGVGSSR